MGEGRRGKERGRGGEGRKGGGSIVRLRLYYMLFMAACHPGYVK